MDALKEGLLKLDPGLLLWTIITFITLVLILWKAAWKPIIEALDGRAEKVRGDIEKAEKTRLDAEELLRQHREMLDKAKGETAKIIEDGRASAEKLRSEMLEKANQESKEIAERARKDITLAKDKALSELKVEVVNIATDIASKIIAKNLKPEDQDKIVNDTLGGIKNIQ